MAVKGGQILHLGNETMLLDRLQTAGPGTVNIRRETIYELGNYLSVGQVADIPDLSFSMESQDVTCSMEALLQDVDVKDTHEYDPARATTLNVKSMFKPGQSAANAYDAIGSAAVPGLRLESLSYRFGVGNQNARQTASLKGDSLYYNPGSTYIQRVAGSAAAGQTIVLTNPAYGVREGGVLRRTLAITAGDKRLNFGSDYTETYGTVTAGAAATTVHLTKAIPTTDKVAVTYASPAVETFPQSVHALVSGVSGTLSANAAIGATTFSTTDTTLSAGQAVILDDTPGNAAAEVVVIASVAGTVYTIESPTIYAHTTGGPLAVYAPTVKPAALRGKDIDIYIGPAGQQGDLPADTIGTRAAGVQSVQVDWKVTLQNDEEMGNYHYVNIDYDVPVVSGQVQFKPADVAALLAVMQELSGVVAPLESAEATTSPLLDVQVVLKNPIDGRVLKRLHVPDARFSLPGYSARVQQKLDFQASFQSDRGELKIYDY